MGVGIYYFYHGFGLKAFEGRHIRILILLHPFLKFRFLFLFNLIKLNLHKQQETQSIIHIHIKVL